MTVPLPACRRRGTVTWTVHCDEHSDPDAGIHVFACGMLGPYRSACPCVISDRYLVVEAVHAGRQWWACADVLICRPQSCRSAALLATSVALARLPGCTLAVASFRDSGCAVRHRTGSVLFSPYPAEPALLAAYAHRVGAL